MHFPRVGEQELPSASKFTPSSQNKRFRHNKVTAPKPLDSMSVNYERKLKKRKKTSSAVGGERGGPAAAKSELKTADQIRKARMEKQKRQEKNARPSKRRGGKRDRRDTAVFVRHQVVPQMQSPSGSHPKKPSRTSAASYSHQPTQYASANVGSSHSQKRYMQNYASMVSPEILEEIQEAFEIFDDEGTGYIETRALKSAFKALGWDNIDQKTLHKWKLEVDPEGKGKISFGTFKEFAAKMITMRDPQEEILRAFSLFKMGNDPGNNDYITIDDLRRVALVLNEQVPEEDLREMLEVADTDGDGKVNLQDFSRIMKKTGLFQ
ncbi:Centrin-1 [Spiromyces aspiralis]|uniref:Centrin-1 n=1 Tax=Spiromyces aspiralis TaxID=68401 RepID=A0ACC1HH18_9FUNG|nr:Centrin-1 [Spiromyces aspiralis]